LIQAIDYVVGLDCWMKDPFWNRDIWVGGGRRRLYPGVDVMSLRATYYERKTSWWLGSAGAENLEEARRN